MDVKERQERLERAQREYRRAVESKDEQRIIEARRALERARVDRRLVARRTGTIALAGVAVC
jgi:hypothetical protein